MIGNTRVIFALASALATVLMLPVTSAHPRALSAGDLQDQAPVFRTGADVVSVEASVRRERRPVTGLTAADFELLDNGVAQEISDVSYEKLPVDVTVLLDVSASVTGPVLEDLRRALKQLRTDLGTRDRLRLVTFDMRVRRLVDFADPAGATDQALASIAPVGSSSIFDSLAVALASPTQSGRRQLVVLFSDGQDSSSISDTETLFDVARRTSPTVAVVLASTARQRPASLIRTSSKTALPTVGVVSDRIAAETGGFVVEIEPGENLSSTFRRVLEQFRTSYVLYFTPRGVPREGSHTLELRVKRAKVEIRSRSGYVWR